jgi:hypothetical protein
MCFQKVEVRSESLFLMECKRKLREAPQPTLHQLVAGPERDMENLVFKDCIRTLERLQNRSD